MNRITYFLIAALLAFSAEAAPKKKAAKKSRKPASAQTTGKKGAKKPVKKAEKKAAKAVEKEVAYCEGVIDGILAQNGLGSFAKPEELKTKMKPSEGSGFIFKSRAMKKGEGVYVYAPKKDGTSRIRVAYFHPDGKKRNLNFELNKKCLLKDITGIYGPTADRYSVTKNSCNFIAKNTSRKPASEAIALKRKSKKELARQKKENARLKKFGARFPVQGVSGVYELCDAYGSLFGRNPASYAGKKKPAPMKSAVKEPAPAAEETILPPSDMLQEQAALVPEDPFAPGTPPPPQAPLNSPEENEAVATGAPQMPPPPDTTAATGLVDHGEPPATE